MDKAAPQANASADEGKGASAPIAENLILFSDGTGNSSAKLFKTNVWRMYEAVNLGAGPPGSKVQVALYDNGVGTQAIRILALVAGAFGFGLRANVLRLYRFACRNATPDCRIFCFGFSRGAFTIRIVAAILAQYGLVEYETEAELDARTRETFRRFMRDNNPNVASFVGRIGRAIRDGVLAVGRFVLRRNRHSDIRYSKANVHFIGVWDTVAAYGGPIVEITRGIDDYLWPLTMTDTCLNPNVNIARHALSLDDERDAFQPVLWDEREWHRKACDDNPGDDEARDAQCQRMKQVWFAGMHADVGGGYPDPSLSFVSLVWMMHEAEDAGLVLLPRIKERYENLSNSLGPIHDSRGGLGAYYRPQPRKIAAFLHPDSGMDLEQETLSLRDPVLGELPKPPHGLLRSCVVHESVVARLVEGTDDYAPITLPPQIGIEPYSPELTGGNPIVDEDLMERLKKRDDDWYARQERIWDIVLQRRLAYFVAVLFTILFVSLPWWVRGFAWPTDSDSRSIMQRLTSWRHHVPVGWLEPWLLAFEINWLLFLFLLLGALAFTVSGTSLAKQARTRSYRLWRQRIYDQPYTAKLPGWLTRWRNGWLYQRSMQALRWRILPAVAAAVLVFMASWIGMAAITQAFWAKWESELCRDDAGPPGTVVRFGTWQQCKALAQVERGHRYKVIITVDEPWTDGSVPADPIGVRPALWRGRVFEQEAGHAEARTLREEPPTGALWAQSFGMPFRRVIEARYLQVGVKMRSHEGQDGIIPRMRVKILEPTTRDGVTFTDIVEATSDGTMSLFVNDAAFLGWNRLYGNNCGTATVRVVDLDPSGSNPAALIPPVQRLKVPQRCER